MTFYFMKIVSLLGGLALFLFGMDVMGKALERQAGGKLQTILAKMSSNVIKGFLLGIGVTAVIQSSSATTVMVVGFVNSGIMTLKQAVGVIMGSNIGTTVTAWILSLSGLEGDSFIIQLFKPTTLAPLIGVVGIALFMFGSEKRKGVGTIMLGFMALMTGMDIMGDSMEFLESEPWFAQLMISFSNPIIGIIFGAALTAIIQSSSASIGILQGLCVTGAVTYGAAIPIILGQNIGTCITAILGSMGATRNARRTGLVHLLFNVVGVLIFVILFYGLGLFIDWKFLTMAAAPWDIAVIHTCFNVAATAILLPMNELLVKLAYLFIPKQGVVQQTALLDERLLGTPAVAVQRAKEIADRMAQKALDATQMAIGLTRNFDEEILQQIKDLENETDNYQDALGTYLVKLSSKRLSTDDNRLLHTLLYTISDFERMGDHAWTIAKAAREMHDKGIVFSEKAQKELAVLEAAVMETIQHTVTAFTEKDMDEAKRVEPREQVVDVLVKEVKSRHVSRLRNGMCSVEYGFVLEDLLTAYERSADHCSNVAVEMLQAYEDRMDAHEYLNAVKESEQFTEQVASYRERYNFPTEE